MYLSNVSCLKRKSINSPYLKSLVGTYYKRMVYITSKDFIQPIKYIDRPNLCFKKRKYYQQKVLSNKNITKMNINGCYEGKEKHRN